MPSIAIIGAGLAGWTTIRELRKLDPTTPLTLVTADSGDFYAKPALSNALAQGKSPAQLVVTPAAKMAETLGVTLMAHTQVQAIDTAAQTVTTSQGKLSYSRLVLATGAQPIRVGLQGNAAHEVQSVNSLTDFAAFHAKLTPGARVLIMGAGLIGCEFANDLAAAGYRVQVVDPGTRPLAALLPPEASAQLQTALSDLGVQWQFGCTVQTVEHQPTPQGAEYRVLLSNGQSASVDRLLSAIGLRADVTLAQAAGIVCERGIVVNAQLQTSAPHVYALGDCAAYPEGAAHRALPYVMPIMAAAKVLAANLAGQSAQLQFPLMPVSIKTPALPLVVASPALGRAGAWTSPEAGLWQFHCKEQVQRGFVLAGKATTKRTEQAKLTIQSH